MKSIIVTMFFILMASAASATDLKGFGVIREFDGTDTAAMFGLLPSAGLLQITGVTGPSFLGTARIGQLNQVAIDHLFLRSANPMDEEEKQNLINQYNGAEVIYFEGYAGNLCTTTDTEHEVGVTGTIDGISFTATFQFIALPNSSGDCTYHEFITSSQQAQSPVF
jgi:hypothetical protein